MTDHAKVEQRHLDAARAIPRIPGLGHTERNVAQALADAEMAGREWMRDAAVSYHHDQGRQLVELREDAQSHQWDDDILAHEEFADAIASLPLTDTPEAERIER